MSTIGNSTLEGDSASSGADTIKFVLVATVLAVLALSVVIVLAFVLRACWRKRQGSKEYRRIPTKDTPDRPESEPRVRRKVQIILPDPPPPKTRITLATDITKGSSNRPRYLPHAATGGEKTPAEMEGVAAPQAFLCLKMSINDNRLMVELQNVAGLPCRADGTPVDPFVKLNVMSREKKHVNRKLSTGPVAIDPEFMQTVYCGSVVREELEHCILHIEVLDHWSFSHHILATADLRLDQVKEKPTKSFKVPLNIIKSSGHSTVTFNGHALISLYYDKSSSKLSVIIPKVELSLNSLPLSTDYWIKVVITKGEKCLVKEKVKHVSIVSDEIHFNKSIICHISDVTSLSIQCNLVTMTTINFMRRPKVLGTVTLGSHVQGQALRHWNDMLNTPNTPIAEWHHLT